MVFYKYHPVKIKRIATIFIFLCCSACSSAPDSPNEHSDPIEWFNRPSWTFTWEYADKYVISPASQSYVNNVPTELRTGLYNMALNLNEPSSIINNLLQQKYTDAGTSTGRFVLNSTVGLLGFFDPASDFGWLRKEEEFGEVLGVYGVGDGPYIVVPVLGPSSVREEVGDYVDNYYWPLAAIDFWPNILRLTILGLEKRASIAEQEELINDAVDPYIFVRNAYFQGMNYKVYDGNPPLEINQDEEDALEAALAEFDE